MLNFNNNSNISIELQDFLIHFINNDQGAQSLSGSQNERITTKFREILLHREACSIVPSFDITERVIQLNLPEQEKNEIYQIFHQMIFGKLCKSEKERALLDEVIKNRFSGHTKSEVLVPHLHHAYKIFNSLPIEDRTAKNADLCIELFKDMDPESSEMGEILKATNHIDQGQRIDVLKHAMQLFSQLKSEDRGQVIQAVGVLPPTQRAAITGQVQRFLSFLPGNDSIIKIIQAVSEISPKYRNEVIRIADQLCDLLISGHAEIISFIHSLFENCPNEEDRHENIDALRHVRTDDRVDVIRQAGLLWQGILDRSSCCYKILLTLGDIPGKERASIIQCAKPLWKGIISGFGRNAIIKALTQVPQKERADVVEQAYLLCENLLCGINRAEIIAALNAISPSQRADVARHAQPLCTDIPYGEERAILVQSIYHIPQPNRAELIQETRSLYSRITSGEKFATLLQGCYRVRLQEPSFLKPLIQDLKNGRDPKKVLQLLKDSHVLVPRELIYDEIKSALMQDDQTYLKSLVPFLSQIELSFDWLFESVKDPNPFLLSYRPSSFHFAYWVGAYQWIKKWIEKGFIPPLDNSEMQEMLFNAIHHNEDILNVLLAKPTIDFSPLFTNHPQYGFNLLHYACCLGKSTLVRLLMKVGFPVLFFHEQGHTSYMYAQYSPQFPLSSEALEELRQKDGGFSDWWVNQKLLAHRFGFTLTEHLLNLPSVNLGGFYFSVTIKKLMQSIQAFSDKTTKELPEWKIGDWKSIHKALEESLEHLKNPNKEIDLSQINCIPSGWEGHGTSAVICGDLLIKGNRGDGCEKPGLYFYQINNVNALKDAVKTLVDQYQTSAGIDKKNYFNHTINKELGLKELAHISHKEQRGNNCSWAAAKLMNRACICIQLLKNIGVASQPLSQTLLASIEEIKNKSEGIYRSWFEDDRETAVEEQLKVFGTICSSSSLSPLPPHLKEEMIRITQNVLVEILNKCITGKNTESRNRMFNRILESQPALATRTPQFENGKGLTLLDQAKAKKDVLKIQKLQSIESKL